MLTAQVRATGPQRGDKVLDLGCGFGRHAFEAARRGASVVALDAGRDEVNGVADMFAAMVEAGELDAGSVHADVVQGDALHLPFPDGAFDRVICSEVLEHIPDDLAAMARTRPRAATRRHHGHHRAALRARSSSTGRSRTSTTTCPAGTSASTASSVLAERLQLDRHACVTGHHYAHGLHSPYWWLKCSSARPTTSTHWSQRYHRLLVWDIMKRPALTRYAEQVLSPVMGKSLVVYLRKAGQSQLDHEIAPAAYPA